MTGWRDGQIRSHDADTGQLLWSIDNAHAHGVTSLIVSHNERFLVTGGMEGELRVWELRSRELVRKTRFAVSGSRLPPSASYLAVDLRRGLIHVAVH